jgi:phosphoglycolate phosphatase
MIVLFWDIDGTLLTTGKAGVPAWEAAVAEVTSRQFQLSSVEVTGRTDFQIARATFEKLELPMDEAALRHLVRRYEELLPSYLPLRQGRVLPNVREILDRLRGRSDVRSYLLTGNTRGGARAKLTHYQLFDYFPDGAFAEDFGERATIAQRALALARRAGPLNEDHLFVIGDTPHDITCAAAIAARTIAVGTGGGYTVEQLQQYQPWRAFEQLPPADQFIALIDETVRASAPK